MSKLRTPARITRIQTQLRTFMLLFDLFARATVSLAWTWLGTGKFRSLSPSCTYPRFSEFFFQASHPVDVVIVGCDWPLLPRKGSVIVGRG